MKTRMKMTMRFFLLLLLNLSLFPYNICIATEFKPIYNCENLKDFKEKEKFDPCLSSLKNSPKPYAAPIILYGYPQMIYEKSCPQGGCLIEMNELEINKAIDYYELQAALLDKLKESGLKIAFSGYSSGEIFITTVSKSLDENIDEYYQIRVIARNCHQEKLLRELYRWAEPCGLYAGASLIKTDKKKQEIYFKSTELSEKLEKIVFNHIWLAIKKADEEEKK